MNAKEMWRYFSIHCKNNNFDISQTEYDAWHFCDNEKDANSLAQLVLNGKKQATASCLWCYDLSTESLPIPGDYSVILDWSDNALCIIQITNVNIVPFDQVSEEFAALEGEGDKSLRYWRNEHQNAFSRELKTLGKAFNYSMPAVCQTFDVVFKHTSISIF